MQDFVYNIFFIIMYKDFITDFRKACVIINILRGMMTLEKRGKGRGFSAVKTINMCVEEFCDTVAQ